MNKCELLAPAGSYEKMIYALKYGADAVYAGTPDFSLRARINKFDEKQIIKAIDYVHGKKKKIYITINIFAHNNHLEKVEKFLKVLRKNPPDAIIATDLGVIEQIKRIIPKANIHLSTQANTTNWQAVNFWKKQGIKRIILARELSLREINEIHKKVPNIELECFVHGAMCMAYSGRCLLSSWTTGRSSNLGDCSQNCRWRYKLVEEKRPNEYIPVEEDRNGSYLLNSKDMCLIDHLEELKKSGITSFKIEGRAKSVYYLSQVVKAYREALDMKEAGKERRGKLNKIKRDLNKLQNRGYTTGFVFGESKLEGLETNFSHTSEEHIFAGEVLEKQDKDGLILIKVHNALYVGDKVEFINPKKENMKCRIKGIYEIDDKRSVTEAHGGQNKMVFIKVKSEPAKYSILRKTK